jgi:tetratricopeptide (TPR) repeat protein
VGAALVLGVLIGFGLKWTPAGPPLSSDQKMAQLADDAETHYKRGRQLLAADQAEEALVHLKRARDLHPDRALYQFWVGVSYWALQDYDEELMHYEAALDLDPNFLPAHVYIGHNYLDRGEWQKALSHYRRVLRGVPNHSEALFNTGLALRLKGDKGQENEAWSNYLDLYDRGEQAMQAVEYLNANGDFTYRPIHLGMVGLVKKSIRFNNGSAHLDQSTQVALDDVSRVVARNPKLQLHIVAYTANDAPLAKTRAHAIKRYLSNHADELAPERIKTSWFGVPEKIEFETQSYQLENSIQLFATKIDAL